MELKLVRSWSKGEKDTIKKHKKTNDTRYNMEEILDDYALRQRMEDLERELEKEMIIRTGAENMIKICREKVHFTHIWCMYLSS